MAKNHQPYPLISCVCVTENRVNKLKRAVACFRAQTYPNKELVIVYKDSDVETRRFLEKEGDDLSNIMIPTPTNLTLGDLRNISIELSKGNYFCNWDDDDWYHTRRLEEQMKSMRDNYHDASMLVYYLLFDDLTKQAYFSQYRLWESSLLCKKELVNEKVNYPPLAKNEDKEFVERLIMNSKAFPVSTPSLYICVLPGSNTPNQSQFQSFLAACQKLPAPISQLINDILEGRKYSVEEASAMLSSAYVLKEINYFASYKEKLTKEVLKRSLQKTTMV